MTARHLALPPRQHQVLALLASGLNTKEIAERCGITDKGVYDATCKIKRRLGIWSNVTLTHYAIAKGIVPLVDPTVKLRKTA